MGSLFPRPPGSEPFEMLAYWLLYVLAIHLSPPAPSPSYHQTSDHTKTSSSSSMKFLPPHSLSAGPSENSLPPTWVPNLASQPWPEQKLNDHSLARSCH